MQIPQQQPRNGGLVWTGLNPVKYISESNDVGVEALFLFCFFSFNQKPVTLFQFHCSFLRTGTGLEMEAEFVNPELTGLLYAGSRHKQESNVQWIQSQHKHVDKRGTSTWNNSHIYSGLTTKSFSSSVGGGLPSGHSAQTAKKRGNNKK